MQKLYQLAIAKGEMDAIEFIYERLEGKVPQPIGDSGPLVHIGYFVLKGAKDRGIDLGDLSE